LGGPTTPADDALAAAQSALRDGNEERATRLIEAAVARGSDSASALKIAVVARSFDRTDLGLLALRDAGASPDLELTRFQLRQEQGEPVADELAAFLSGLASTQRGALQLAGALVAEKRIDEAERHLAEHVGTWPDWIAGHQELAQLRWQDGQALSSGRSFQDAVERLPDNELLWAAWLGSIKSMGDREGFLATGQRARSRFPGSALIAMISADGLSEFNMVREADSLFARLAQVTDADFDAARMRHAMRLRRYDQAISLGSAAVSKHGKSECWAWLGSALRHTGHLKADWFYRGSELTKCMDVGLSGAELSQLAAVLRRLHGGQAQPLGQSPRGGTQTTGALLKRGEPEIRILRKALREAVTTYFAGLPRPDPQHPLLGRIPRGFRFEGAWSVRLRNGGHHVSHIHSRGLLSSALYVDVPARLADDPKKSGWLQIGVPPLPEPAVIKPLLETAPAAGKLVLFPSVFWHGTRSFCGADERLTVAFDVVGL